MPQVLLKKLTMVSNQLKSSMSDDFCVWEATNFLYYLPPSVIVGVLLSVNDQVIERPATKTIPLVTPAKNTGARLCSRSCIKKVVVHLAQWVQRDQLISWARLYITSTLHFDWNDLWRGPSQTQWFSFCAARERVPSIWLQICGWRLQWGCAC